LLQADYKRPNHAREQSKESPVGFDFELSYFKDFFYICTGHLKDRAFCTPDADEAAAVAERQKKADLDLEIENVKKEYAEKLKRKAERRKEKDKKKDKDKEEDKKDKKNDKEEDEKDELEKDAKV